MKEARGLGNRDVEYVVYSLDTKFFGSSCHRWLRRPEMCVMEKLNVDRDPFSFE